MMVFDLVSNREGGENGSQYGSVLKIQRTRMAERSNGVWERKKRDRDDSKNFSLSHWEDEVTIDCVGKHWGGCGGERWNQKSGFGFVPFKMPIQFLWGGIKEALDLGVWSSGRGLGCRHKFGRCQSIDCPPLSAQKWLDFIETKQS